jgi:hypothetical protein
MKEVVRVRVMCLHGFRTSGSILQKQVGKWEKSVLERMDLRFPDAPFPAQGKSDVEEHFPPPYYEWFQFNPQFTEYQNMDECLQFIEEYMIKKWSLPWFTWIFSGCDSFRFSCRSPIKGFSSHQSTTTSIRDNCRGCKVQSKITF